VSAWAVERVVGPAATLHARDGWESAVPLVRLLEVAAPALVLGSTQPLGDVDEAAAAEAGIDVVRRSSGGGAVLLIPGEHVWLDVVVPRSDAAWTDDISRAAWWLGERWAEVLAPRSLEVHRGRLGGGEFGRVVCFAGRGPGEVVADGAKLVGVAQVRRRAGARFQSMVHHVVRPEVYRSLLAPGLARIGATDAGVADVATVTSELAGPELVTRLAARLGS